ncbi:endonuclease/exonuclease/phosphatase family protein [Roseobacter sp. YSTF-M11]|uniref:Endonuclease/exonuclease/phosphatase family protein n=1 Tax=Roseobacter insulae TaxID=2859783 RepID=A0A9X1FR83_9RHOB|nr:endonuclease/exonuclease/phosphatase family protein [Roseobacter insulae]MBW4706299.1 endonuclease/exonuclease/phosphatase family protein [Roseobacter insulae]
MAETFIRIGSYNVRKARGLDNKRNPERTLQVINRLDADVVVLQEADKRLGPRPPAIPRELIEAETDYSILEICENGVSLGWHGNAILLRRELQVTDATPLELPGFEPRGAVRINLDVGAGLCVVAAHLGLLRRDRRTQLNLLRQTTDESGHTVIAGDFNEWSQRRGLEPLTGRFNVHAPGRSFHARRPVAALDRFALSYGLQMDGGGVEEGALARRASDHLPVWADIAVPNQPLTCKTSPAASTP